MSAASFQLCRRCSSTPGSARQISLGWGGTRVGDSSGTTPPLWRRRHNCHGGLPTKPQRCFNLSARRPSEEDPRVKDVGFGEDIADQYVRIRKHYDTPHHPIVLAHGLFGFSELRLAGRYLPPILYWHGIKDALEAQGVSVFATSVPPSGTIAQRAAKLADDIAVLSRGRPVNVVAHSMGGLDARHMISVLRPAGVRVAALVTVATPHRGSAYADTVLAALSPGALPLVRRVTGLETGAFAQLTRRYMAEEFNPATPDEPGVRYFSYGAAMARRPGVLSPFRRSWRVLEELEGPNDGLVSVESSKWGAYKGTIVGVSHLDLINWNNRLRWAVRKWMGQGKTFNAVAFYLDIADMLAKEGL